MVASGNEPLRVLVVDDLPDAADALAAVVRLLGCETQVCYGGAAAVEAVRATLPDVLLLDLTMPRVSGLDVATVARNLAGHRPLLIAATTALGDVWHRTETALAGFHFHLVKPIDLPNLRGVLDQCRTICRPPSDVPEERSLRGV